MKKVNFYILWTENDFQFNPVVLSLKIIMEKVLSLAQVSD